MKKYQSYKNQPSYSQMMGPSCFTSETQGWSFTITILVIGSLWRLFLMAGSCRWFVRLMSNFQKAGDVQTSAPFHMMIKTLQKDIQGVPPRQSHEVCSKSWGPTTVAAISPTRPFRQGRWKRPTARPGRRNWFRLRSLKICGPFETRL